MIPILILFEVFGIGLRLIDTPMVKAWIFNMEDEWNG